jgi:hypothetical protein
MHFGSVPVLAHTITGTGICYLCPYWYWHFCTLVQYQYWHIPLPELAFKNGARPRYWHCFTLVHYWYGHSPLLVPAFNFARTGIGISALRFITGTGTVNYPHWHSKMVPVPVLAFLHFGSVPVWAHFITRTGISTWCPYCYWHFCT